MYAAVPETRWLRSFVVSLAVHAALIAAFAVSALFGMPASPPEPAPIRVQLLRIAEPASAAPAPAAPPAAKIAPIAPAVAKPKPVAPRTAKPASRPAPAKSVPPPPSVDAGGPVAAASVATSAVASGVAGASSSGFASGRASIGSGDELDAYIAQVRELILKHKRYPPLARRRGIEGRLVLSLAIAADGDVAITRASGAASSLLEEGARAAVAAASPLPPPPAGALRLDVPVRFDLKE